MSVIRFRRARFAILTLFALPVPVIAALVSIHCHGAALTNRLTRSVADGNIPANTAVGQGITAFIVSPAAVVGGSPSTATVYIRYPAPSGGIAIRLDGNDGVGLPSQVVIPQGKTSIAFNVTTRSVEKLKPVELSAYSSNTTISNTITLLPSVTRAWYVSPQGKPNGKGTQTDPYDLKTALSDTVKIKPGDVVWLMAGTYKGSFVSTISGHAEAPVIVRAVPGQRVIIDKQSADSAKQPALKVKGSWVWFWGIEIMNSNPDRRRNSPYTGEDEPWRGSGVDVYASNVKFINMIFHDNGHGIWDKQDMTEVHGCLFFYNGNNKREHAMYIGNEFGTKYITDNIVFDQAGYGILAYSNSTKSAQKGLHIEGNIVFNNGVITNDDQKTGNVQVGGVNGVSAERITIKNNYVYNSTENATSKNTGIKLGYEDTGNRDVSVLDNYIASKTPLLVWWWQDVDLRGNTISTGDDVDFKVPTGINRSSYRWDFNTYLSVGGRPFSLASWRQRTGFDNHSVSRTEDDRTDVFVRPNRYEPGRANIVVYNWRLQNEVAVDLSGVIPVGTMFEVRDAQNYFGPPVVAGKYNGAQVKLPMKLSTVTTPIGTVERLPRHTAPEFAAFVVVPVRPLKLL